MLFFRFFSFVLILSITGTAVARAENKHSLVIAAGVAPNSYFFSKEDDLRTAPSSYNGGSASSAFAINGSVELYLVGGFGIGKKYSQLAMTRKYSSPQFETVWQEWEVIHHILTANWIFWGGTKYYRGGIFAGGGPSTYKINEGFTSQYEPEYETSKTTTGDVSVLGAFWDFGGKGFGGRCGLDLFSTRYENMEIKGKDYAVNADGAMLFCAVRWAICIRKISGFCY